VKYQRITVGVASGRHTEKKFLSVGLCIIVRSLMKEGEIDFLACRLYYNTVFAKGKQMGISICCHDSDAQIEISVRHPTADEFNRINRMALEGSC